MRVVVDNRNPDYFIITCPMFRCEMSKRANTKEAVEKYLASAGASDITWIEKDSDLEEVHHGSQC